MKRILILALGALLCTNAVAGEPAAFFEDAHLSRFGEGPGPTEAKGVTLLLPAGQDAGQSNAMAFDRRAPGAFESFDLRGSLVVAEEGDGGSISFLSTEHFGTRGPAPYLASVVEPNLKGTFAIGIDVHNPPGKEMFSPWGNYEDRPQREISLHWDGREIVKRVAPKEFRGAAHDFHVAVKHVVGGAEISVVIAGGRVYDAYFIPGMQPYEMRVAASAGTRPGVSSRFDLWNLTWDVGEKAKPRRRPLHVEVFNHVLTNNKKTSYDATVSLPPLEWAFGRVILTLDIHDAGKDWDEWDRNGEVYLIDDDGTSHPIAPFITSYRTECHWAMDVTHFRPWLTGKRTFRIAAGTNFYKNRGYMMSLSLDFHHGTQPLMPRHVEPLWVGKAKYQSEENHFQDFFQDIDVGIPEDTKAARIYTTTTGHSQIGEFTPSKRTIVVSPGLKEARELRFDNTLWKTDVYLNPNRPQFGTWQYARAGWAPGDMVWPWIIDLKDALPTDSITRFRYLPQPYSFDPAGKRPPAKQINAASHVVRSYLILYGDGAALTAAPTLRIASVAKESNAANAGIKVGDYLARYDGNIVDSVDDLRAAIQGAADKTDIPIVVFRGTERMELVLKPGRMGISLGGG